MAKKYLNVAYKDRDMAKRLGARWDANVRRWYVPAGSDLAKILSWRAPTVTTRNVAAELGTFGAKAKTSKAANHNAPTSIPTEQSQLPLAI